MEFVETTSDEWLAIHEHHDVLVRMAELELQADRIRESDMAEAAQQLQLKSIEMKMHELDKVITHFVA